MARNTRGKTQSKTQSKSKSKSKPKTEREGYHLPVRSEEEQLEGLSDDLVEAWLRLRSHLLGLGEQESHTSHRSIMFARKTCYAFVRPKKSFLELNFFLPEPKDSELIRKVTAVSKMKFVHIVQLTHA